jgi:hypothetical protein
VEFGYHSALLQIRINLVQFVFAEVPNQLKSTRFINGYLLGRKKRNAVNTQQKTTAFFVSTPPRKPLKCESVRRCPGHVPRNPRHAGIVSKLSPGRVVPTSLDLIEVRSEIVIRRTDSFTQVRGQQLELYFSAKGQARISAPDFKLGATETVAFMNLRQGQPIVWGARNH